MSEWMPAVESPGVGWGQGVTDGLLHFCESPTREKLQALNREEKEPL